jgi:hypothetical protein
MLQKQRFCATLEHFNHFSQKKVIFFFVFITFCYIFAAVNKSNDLLLLMKGYLQHTSTTVLGSITSCCELPCTHAPGDLAVAVTTPDDVMVERLYSWCVNYCHALKPAAVLPTFTYII